MKKGLLITLVVVVALLSSSSFAYAPVLKNIPDIIIGDHEQGDTNNFFVFSDAFVFDTYVTDRDSTVSDLRWSYHKTGQTPSSPTQTIVINNMDEEPSNFVTPTENIRLSHTTASFRNDTLSPRTKTTLPFNTPSGTLANVFLALYVSDGTFTDSQEITVYSVDNGFDGYSRLGYNPTYTEAWDTADGWVNWDGLGGVAPASYGGYDAANKRLIVNFPVSPFGGWGWTEFFKPATAPATGFANLIPFTASSAYVMKVRLSSDTNTRVPQNIRLRAQDANSVWTACGCFGSDQDNPAAAGEAGMPQTTPGDFFIMWEPQGSTADGIISIDAWTTPYLGSIYVDDLSVYTIPLADITKTTEATVTSFAAWGTQLSGVTVTGPQITLGTINSAEGWHDAGAYITLTDTLTPGFYKTTYNLSKTGTTTCDQTRLRVGDAKNAGYSSNYAFNDSLTNTVKRITSSPQAFYEYHYAANTRATGVGDFAIFVDGIRSAGDTAAPTLLTPPLVIEKLSFSQLN
jgi:hypothetical protein